MSTFDRFPLSGDFIQGNMLTASAGWNGTAGSGFGGAYGAVPTDPVRTTAKPICRLLVPPNQAFTKYLLVGVIAGANNAGSILGMGLEKVVIHYEGNTKDILRPTWQTITDANGDDHQYFGWWCWLQRSTATVGQANLYAEAIPLDGTMQRRVVGPYTFLPSLTLYDYDIEIAPTPVEIVGQRYKTFAAAFNFLRLALAKHCRITVTEAGTYNAEASAAVYTPPGYCTIRATVPITFESPDTSTEADMLIRPLFNRLHLQGENITVDFNLAYAWQGEPGGDYWIDGVTLTNSNGRDWLFRKGPHNTSAYVFSGNPWFTEVTATNLPRPWQSANLARGCHSSMTYDDIADEVGCQIGCTADDHDSDWFRQRLDALTVTYSGAGTTATIEMSLSNGANNRVITAKVDGATVGTFTLLNTYAAWVADTNYTVENVRDWFNTLADWTATTTGLDTTRRAGYLQSGTTIAAWGPVSAIGGVTLNTFIDLHTDWVQYLGAMENVFVGFNIITNQNGQLLQISPSPTTNTFRDYLFVNNIMDGDPASVEGCNLGGVTSHFVFAHNTIVQDVRMRTDLSGGAKYDPDSYCLITNSVMVELQWSSTVDANQVMTKNHLFTGTSPTNATGTTIGGTYADLFVDAAAGDFAPDGALLTNLKVPAFEWTQDRERRAATAAAGAL